MRFATRLFRSAILATLLLQPVGSGVVRLGHMRAEAAGLGHLDHIQAPGEGACVPHSHDSCQICRIGHSVPLPSTHRDRLHTQELTRRIDRVAALTILPARAGVLPLGSRAPPLV
jgi:hypothetical protein